MGGLKEQDMIDGGQIRIGPHSTAPPIGYAITYFSPIKDLVILFSLEM